jgi:hypothetical protein
MFACGIELNKWFQEWQPFAMNNQRIKLGFNCRCSENLGQQDYEYEMRPMQRWTGLTRNFINNTGKVSEFDNYTIHLRAQEKEDTLTRICSGIHACCTAQAQSQRASTLSWSSMYDTVSTYQSRQDVGEASLTSEKDYADMHLPVQPALTNKIPLICYWNKFLQVQIPLICYQKYINSHSLQFRWY